MAKGTHTFLLAAGLIVSACSGPAHKIDIRPVGIANQARPASEQIAYAQAQLALGSPGLALEAFRKAAREQPDNPLALRGIGDSYAAIGRNDLARRYYEAALALAPQDPNLLRAVSTPVRVAAPVGHSIEVAQDEHSTATRREPAAPLISPTEAAAPAPSSTVTVKLPPATSAPAATAAIHPRLERLSPGEVALVTTAKPLWEAVVVSRTRLSTTVRWLPVRSATAEPQIRLLNAARYQGLAARTMQLLSRQGWGKLAIGNAPKVRLTSVVLYAPHHEAAARTLAAQLNCRTVPSARNQAIVILLGRDAVRGKVRLARG